MRCTRDQASDVTALSSRLAILCMLAGRPRRGLSKVSLIRQRLGEKRGTPCWTGRPRWKTAWQPAQPSLPPQQKLPRKVV